MQRKVFISVVIATFGRPEPLSRCLEAFTRIKYPHDQWRILVVDDGSPMPLDSIVQGFALKLPIQLVRQQNQGAGAARNHGARLCDGDLIAFTDDDCLPEENWLLSLAERHLKDPTACIGGATVNALARNPYSAASQLLIDYLYRYYFPQNSGRFFASNNVAFPKRLFDDLGGFDTRFPRAGAEDRDICRRWIAQGYGTTFAPEAIVLHEHLMTLQGFWKQHFNYGRGAFHFHTIKANEAKAPLRVEPMRFYTDLLSYPLRVKHKFNAIQMSSLLFVSQLANASGFFYEKFSAAKKSLDRAESCEAQLSVPDQIDAVPTVIVSVVDDRQVQVSGAGV
ncbi:MAG TPA: glycosyltransferase [Drouetiella sp.]